MFFTGTGEDEYFLLPKPFESGMLFGTIPERMFEYTEEQDGKEFADAMLWMVTETFNADLTPQIFQPLRDEMRNANFTGAPIIPNYLENVEPSEQFTHYTSQTAIEAGRKFGISPAKLDHRIRGYFGTLGTYALGMSDALITAYSEPEFGERPSRGETWRENIVVRSLIDPLVSEGPPRRTKYTTDLYDMINEVQKTANTVSLMTKRQTTRVEEYLSDEGNLEEFSRSKFLSDARSTLNDINKQMDLVRLSKDLSGDDKRVQLWELQRNKNRFAREVVEHLNERDQGGEK